MGISEDQLETWSHQGAIVTAKNTHESIRRALACHEWPEGVEYEPYLQGSYSNDTNIYGDMDVDLAVQLNSTFSSNLTQEQQRVLGLGPATYHWTDFRRDVLDTLQDTYGRSEILEGDKCLKLAADGGRLPADVVVCTQYRKYCSVAAGDFVEGMCFWANSGSQRIVNYPKVHYANGVDKQQTTGRRFKPTVRVFKNLKDVMIERGLISKDQAPSYFVECLVYNIPDDNFSSSYGDTFCAAVNWLLGTDLTSLRFQNGQLGLCGDESVQWPVQKARQFLQQLVSLWNSW